MIDTRTQLALQVAEMREQITSLRREARTDVLTQLGNRRFLLERLDQESREARPCALILLDIDFFKRVNDEHGHDVGDIVLQTIARVLQANVRTSDDVCRLGGEEFLVICPNTASDAAVELAERLRTAVGFTMIDALGRTVTISAGVAEKTQDDDGPSNTLKRADAALYAAKRGGRNCVLAAR